jgi:transposase
MEQMIQVPLNLPNVRILSVGKTDRGEWLIQVESTVERAVCARCGREIRDFHGWGEVVRLRHLPIFDQGVWIELRPKRYRCRECAGHPTTTQRCAWYDERSPNTRAYEQMALRVLINATLADTARKLGITEETVEGILDRHVETEVKWDEYTYLGLIGIDEVALKKGHRDYVAIVTTRLEGDGIGVLGVLANRKKETVKAFLASIPESLRRTIGGVCTDMHEGYVRAVEEELPWAKVIVDRFHVAKAYRECADEARKKELRVLKKQMSEEEYAEVKGVMWPFRKKPEELEPDEKSLLERVLSQSPALAQAYKLREELTAIFEREYTKAGAKRAIRAWCKRVQASGLHYFNSFLMTLEHWIDEITNYFNDRQTSGFVEGFNNRFKVLKRRCYGIFNVRRIFQRLHLDLEGYRLFGLT